MKQFSKKRWHGIPVGVISALLAVCLLAGGAFAAGAFITTEQTITQEILPVPVYGSITADPIILDSVVAGSGVDQTFLGAVVVELGPDGEGKALRMVCDADSLYTSFDVTITLVERPDGSTVGLYGYGITAGGEVAIGLDVEGTYIFDQTLSVTAGSADGSATSTVTFTLEDYEGPPPPP